MPLTSAALAAHDSAQESGGTPSGALDAGIPGIDADVRPAYADGDFDDDPTLHALAEVDASLARREHVAALLREYQVLQGLTPAEAIGWQDRRERAAASKLQMAWRRRNARQAFLLAVHQSQLYRRAKAATTIQRAQRTRQRVVAEAAPPLSRELICNALCS